MRLPLTSALKTVLMLVIGVLLVLALVDAGSVGLTRLTFPDDAKRAGDVAAATAADQPATRETARLAFEAARAESRQHGIRVPAKGFILYPDGRVTITAARRAPTVLLNRIDALKSYAIVRTTLTVEPSPYS